MKEDSLMMIDVVVTPAAVVAVIRPSHLLS